MPITILEQRYGSSKIDLGACALGKNLNLVSARGFARLDMLAAISGPDTYDQLQNVDGTQRNLKNTHSTEAVNYALSALEVSPVNDARAFPEIILNARNLDVIELYDISTGEIIANEGELEKLISEGPSLVGLRINLALLEYPIRPYEPEISRVDGNHRLSAANAKFEAQSEGQIEFPSVPFALHLGLTKLQERKIFRDINGNHVGMQPAILDAFSLSLAGESVKADLTMRPLWLAAQLAEPGSAFENMISMGGGTKEYKERFGTNPPLKINTLKSAVKLTLQASPQLNTQFSDSPETVLALLNAFWSAVKEVMPDYWAEKKKSILLDTVGLMAFSRWAGSLIEYAIKDGKWDKSYFMPFILAVQAKVPLDRETNKGLAGAAGQAIVFSKLIAAGNSESRGAYAILLEQQRKPDSVETAFGDAGE